MLTRHRSKKLLCGHAMCSWPRFLLSSKRITSQEVSLDWYRHHVLKVTVKQLTERNNFAMPTTSHWYGSN